LRQRLRGPALASYYPPRFRVIQEMRRAYPDWEVFDEKEIERVQKLERAKARGKGAPKKRRTKAGMLIMGLRLVDVMLTG
jgi:small subunit ribosomal protein S33